MIKPMYKRERTASSREPEERGTRRHWTGNANGKNSINFRAEAETYNMYVYLIWNNEGLRKTSTTITIIAMCTFTKDPCYYINELRFEKLWVCIVMGLKN